MNQSISSAFSFTDLSDKHFPTPYQRWLSVCAAFMPPPPPPPPERTAPPRLQDIDTCINLTTLLAWTLLAVTLGGTLLPLGLVLRQARPTA